MLTARGQVVDRVVGLKLGADDYLPKPFDDGAARAHGGRAAPPPQRAGGSAAGTLRVRRRARRLPPRRGARGGEPVELSSLEFQLLRYFIEHRGELLSRARAARAGLGLPRRAATRTVDVHVASLRQKLERHPAKPQHIVTVHRMGYRFVG